MKKKRIIITGGSGFLGKYIAEEAFKKKFDVIVVDKFNSINNKKVKFYQR
jgi:nucleoside-diphosphate-sugar epimerase